MSLYVDAWKLGVKAIAIYRDNCKVAQPLSSSGSEGVAAPPPLLVHERKRLPLDRNEIGRKFQVGDHEGYIHVALRRRQPRRHLRRHRQGRDDDGRG